MVQKVLVVGGGIGGQSVAIALRQAGVSVEIAEIQAEYNVYGVGIIQQANALRALDAIGVADEALRRGHPYGLVKICLGHGVQIGEAGTPPIGRFPSHNGISRRVLHEVLLERANEVGVKFSMNTTIEALEENEDGITVTFNDGRKEKYDIVIGADGVRSKVREMLFGEIPLQYVGLSVWRYPFKRPKDLDTGYMYFGKKSKVGLIPMTEDTIYMFVVTAEGDDNPFIAEETFLPKLREYLSEYPIPMVQECIGQLTDPKLVNYRPMEVVKLSAPWYKGRVMIIGDAAHATIPQLGSGAALAIEDAVVLVEELQKENNVEKAYQNFMNRRLERCLMVVEASETLGKWEYMQFHGQPLPEGANPGMLMGKTCGALTAPI